VIGGVSLQGGVGGIIPAILGSVFVTMLSNAMDSKSAATFSKSFSAA
jgi:ribose/xylose/arabinose/galactoside ABC-type transport system permease subunit